MFEGPQRAQQREEKNRYSELKNALRAAVVALGTLPAYDVAQAQNPPSHTEEAYSEILNYFNTADPTIFTKIKTVEDISTALNRNEISFKPGKELEIFKILFTPDVLASLIDVNREDIFLSALINLSDNKTNTVAQNSFSEVLDYAVRAYVEANKNKAIKIMYWKVLFSLAFDKEQDDQTLFRTVAAHSKKILSRDEFLQVLDSNSDLHDYLIFHQNVHTELLADYTQDPEAIVDKIRTFYASNERQSFFTTGYARSLTPEQLQFSLEYIATNLTDFSEIERQKIALDILYSLQNGQTPSEDFLLTLQSFSEAGSQMSLLQLYIDNRLYIQNATPEVHEILLQFLRSHADAPVILFFAQKVLSAVHDMALQNKYLELLSETEPRFFAGFFNDKPNFEALLHDETTASVEQVPRDVIAMAIESEYELDVALWRIIVARNLYWGSLEPTQENILQIIDKVKAVRAETDSLYIAHGTVLLHAHSELKADGSARFGKDEFAQALLQLPSVTEVKRFRPDATHTAEQVRQDYIEAIITTPGSITLYADAHGAPGRMYFQEGINPNAVMDSDAEDTEIQSLEEFNAVYIDVSTIVSALIERYTDPEKRLIAETTPDTIVVASCYSGNTLSQMTQEISRALKKNNLPLPNIVGMAEYNQFGYSDWSDQNGSKFNSAIVQPGTYNIMYPQEGNSDFHGSNFVRFGSKPGVIMRDPDNSKKPLVISEVINNQDTSTA